jgi:hypothetical protein
MTPVVLRHRGREIAVNSLEQIARAAASFSYFTWSFTTETDEIRLEGTFAAPRAAFEILTGDRDHGVEIHA